MPAHQLNLQDPKTLARLLLAMAVENGGEVRLRGATYDSIDSGRILLIDYDKKRAQVVVKASTNFARAITVQPESYQWTMPQAESPREQAAVKAVAQAQRVHVPSDEELADMEEQAAKRAALAKDIDEGKIPIRLRTVPLKK